MRFSDVYSLTRGDEDDWFDPILSADTALFVDPFLIYLDDDPFWASAHADLIAFFNEVLTLVAKAGAKSSAHWRAAERLMVFPEPAEFCLGVGVRPLGRGTGDTLRKQMLEAAQETAQKVGTDARHIEEMSLFEDGIGADLISDIVCNVLKARFVEYTQAVVARHDIPTQKIAVPHAEWSAEFSRWSDKTIDLPLNPFTDRAVLLTPTRFLRKYPTVDPEEFWDWAWVNHNEDIRGEFGYDIAKNVDGEKIAQFARRNPKLAADYVSNLEELEARPYDVEADPDGEVSWYEAGANLAHLVTAADPPSDPDPDEFCEYVKGLCNLFADYIATNRDGWENLWIGDKPRKERHVQAAFRTFLFLICHEKDIDLSAEPNTGRGAVDFKFSRGATKKALVEVKLMRATDFWHGLEVQTPAYLESEKANCGYYLSVGFVASELTADKKKTVSDAATALSKRIGFTVQPVFVDAQKKPSASKA